MRLGSASTDDRALDGLAARGAPEGLLLWLTTAWTASGVVLCLLFPMLATVLLPLCGVAPFAWSLLREPRLSWTLPSLPTAMLALAAAYLLMNAWWSPNSAEALASVLQLGFIILILHTVYHCLPRLRVAELRAMAWGLIIGLTLGGIIICIEATGGQLIRRLLTPFVPALRPSAAELDVPGFLLNKSIGLLTLLFIPAILVVRSLGLRTRYRAAVLFAFLTGSITILVSDHDSSKAAYLAAAATFGVAKLNLQLAKRLIAAVWVIAVLLVVPASTLLYASGAQQVSWLPESWRQRVAIWGYFSQEVVKSPLLGVGMGAPRVSTDVSVQEWASAPGAEYRPWSSLHSHNAYLQVWYETGAVGALIGLLLGLGILRQIERAPREAHPYLLAQFGTAATLVAFSYSIWAPWLMSSLAMAYVFAKLAVTLPWQSRALAPAGTGRMRLAALSVVALVGLAIAVLHVVKPSHTVVLKPSSMMWESGLAYRAVLPAQFSLILSDRDTGGLGSSLQLFEDGARVGPAHATHAEVREKGAGRYSHWGDELYFSASDNTDPRSNGRRYTVVVTATLRPAVLWGYLFLSGLTLVLCFPGRAAKVRR